MEKQVDMTGPQKIGYYIYFAINMYIVTIGVRKFCTLRNLDSMHPDYVRSGDVAPQANIF